MTPGTRLVGIDLEKLIRAFVEAKALSRSRLGALSVVGSVIGSLIAVPQIALAGDDIRASADVAPTIGYSTNPFAGTGSSLGSAYGEIDVRPEVRVIAEHSVLTVSGRINYEHYFHRYSDSNDYQGGADYAGQVTTRLSAHAAASYDSSIVGGFDVLGPAIDPTQATPPPTTGTDLALFGTRTRRRLLAFSGDAAYALSDRESLTVNGFYNQSRYGGFVSQSSYDGYGGGAGYSRKMSDHLQLGAQASVDRTVYQGLFGTSQVYSLQATINDKINSRWNLVGALGASYSERTLAGNTLSPTGNLQLCRVGPRGSLCAAVSEAVQPTGFTGTVVSQSATLSYSYKLTEHSSFSLLGTYSHNNNPVRSAAVNGIAFTSSYVTASGTYDRTLRERLHFMATIRYRSIDGGGVVSGRPADFNGSLGLMVKLGDYQ